MHTSSLICVCAHIHTSNRVCLCVQISVWASFACLYLYLIIINLIGLKGPPPPFTVASDHWGHSILEFVNYSPPMQVFLHSIAVKYTRYVVQCMSHDRVKEIRLGMRT